MKQALQHSSDNQPSLVLQIIKTILPVVGLCLVLGGGGLVAIFSQKSESEDKVEKSTKTVEVQTQQLQPQLPPYTLFVEGEKVRVKFHGNDSDMEFSNLSNEQKVCLANGGGISCVLPGYVVQNHPTKNTPASPTEDHPRRAISQSNFLRDDAWLVIGLGGALAGYLISILKNK